MDLEQIRALVAGGESETFEQKRTTGERREGSQAICAMLNHRGGRVFFGVGPDGQVSGQQIGDQTIEEVASELRLIDPPALPTVERIAVAADREIIAVTIAAGQNRPYTYRGKAYRRVGNTNVALSQDEYNGMLLERLHGEDRWENHPIADWSIADLDAAEIARTLEESISRGRAEDPGTRDPSAILQGFGLIRNGQLLRAAAVLFGRASRLEAEYPQCLLRVARFRGTDRTEFLDNRQFHGNALDLLVQAERFLRDSLPIAGRILPERLERVDTPLYPPLALREALANAFCHRDYSIGGGSVAIGIYDDRLEVTSSGTLHFGLTVEALLQPHESLPWNPLIARVFFRRGIIESWGRGTLKMAELAEDAGLPKPQFELTAGALTVRFRPDRHTVPHRIATELTERQQRIMELLAEARYGLSLGDIVSRAGSTAQRAVIRGDLALLRHLGLVATRGHARGARWFLPYGKSVRGIAGLEGN